MSINLLLEIEEKYFLYKDCKEIHPITFDVESDDTKNISKKLLLDLEKHNSQYPNIEIKKFGTSHDRFLILDDKKIYHIGASLKDLGHKWFHFQD